MRAFTVLLTTTALTASLFVGIAFAGDNESSTEKKHKTGQPPESAVSICEGKTDGSQCSFSGHRGTESGTCMYTPDKKYFACNPGH